MEVGIPGGGRIQRIPLTKDAVKIIEGIPRSQERAHGEIAAAAGGVEIFPGHGELPIGVEVGGGILGVGLDRDWSRESDKDPAGSGRGNWNVDQESPGTVKAQVDFRIIVQGRPGFVKAQAVGCLEGFPLTGCIGRLILILTAFSPKKLGEFTLCFL